MTALSATAADGRARRILSAGSWCAPITGFRALAAVAVVAGHTFLASHIYPFTGVIHVVGVVVPLFFVISGYALYRPFLVAHARGEPALPAVAFYWRRFLRIYPLWAVALTAYLVLLPGVRPHGGGPVEYLKLYAFWQIYDKRLVAFSGIPAGWFLCDEVAFYAALPVLVWIAGRLARRWGATTVPGRLRAHATVAVALVVLGPAFRTWLVLAHVPGATSIPLSNLDFYGIGMLLAIGSVAERAGLQLPSPVDWLRRRPAVAYVVLLGCVPLMNYIAHRPGESFAPTEDLERYAIYLLMVTPLMIVAVLGGQGERSNRFLGSSRFRRLGRLSLHIYLWHQLVLAGFDRYVRRIDAVHVGGRFTTGLVLTIAAVAVTVVLSAVLQPLLDAPYDHAKHLLDRRGALPLGDPAWWRARPALRVGAVGAATVVLVAVAGVALRYGGSSFRAEGRLSQIEVTGARTGDRVVVAADGRPVGNTDIGATGAGVVANLPAGRYEVSLQRSGRMVVQRTVTVPSATGPAPPSLSAGQQLRPGFNYVRTRDGTTLSAWVSLPGPVDRGPYPTVIEYSLYDASAPGGPQPMETVARALGYAVVAVNLRGTGCSGGVLDDLFGPVMAADGFDAVQTVAAQPWVARHLVGLVGFSYSALAALRVAATRPPALEAVVAASIYGDAYSGYLQPGGIPNVGFPASWFRDIAHDNAPSGSAWVRDRIAGGDTTCRKNQALHGLDPNPPQQLLTSQPDSARFEAWSPQAWAPDVHVPVFVSAQWQDAIVGGGLADSLARFRTAPVVKAVLQNGQHEDAFAPQLIRRWSDFLSLYVGDRVPRVPTTTAVLDQLLPDDAEVTPSLGDGPPPPVDLTRFATVQQARKAYEAAPEVEVLLETGAGGSAGTFAARSSVTFASWPPPATSADVRYLQAAGDMASTQPKATSAARFIDDPARESATYTDQGGVLAPTAYRWPALPNGDVVASWATAPLPGDLALVGTASVDLWIRSDAPDVDLQASLTEVRPDGQEMLLQSGWLRASQRSLDDSASTPLLPVHLFRSPSPLQRGTWTLVRIEVLPFAHVLRAGSRLRLLVSAPGGDRSQWQFLPPAGAVPAAVDVGQGGAIASRLVLPVVPDVATPPGGLPACPSLRGEPCRPYTPLTNLAADP